MYDYNFVLFIVENIDLKTVERIKSPDVSDKIKSDSLKNGEIVNLRYFHNSTSVFVSRGSKEHLAQYLDVLEKTLEDKRKFFN